MVNLEHFVNIPKEDVVCSRNGLPTTKQKEDSSIDKLDLGNGKKVMRIEGNKLVVGCQSYDREDVSRIANFINDALMKRKFDKPEVKLMTWYRTELGDRMFVKVDGMFNVYDRVGTVKSSCYQTLDSVSGCYGKLEEIK